MLTHTKSMSTDSVWKDIDNASTWPLPGEPHPWLVRSEAVLSKIDLIMAITCLPVAAIASLFAALCGWQQFSGTIVGIYALWWILRAAWRSLTLDYVMNGASWSLPFALAFMPWIFCLELILPLGIWFRIAFSLVGAVRRK